MKNTLLTIIAILSATAAFAAEEDNRKSHSVPHDIIVQISADFDLNKDDTLNKEELTLAFETIIEKRISRVKNRQNDAVVFSPIPEDLANYLLRDFDSNENQSLELDELAASKGALRKFKLAINSNRKEVKS